MHRPKKKYILLLSLLILIIIIAALGVVYLNRKTFFPQWYRPKPYTGNIFGKPNVKTNYTFPQNNPQFTAKVAAINSTSLHQQSVTIYPIANTKGTPLFQRNYYDDGFRGKFLTYAFTGDDASFRQSGSLGTIGCTTACTMVWSNFYLWNPAQKTFLLDNASHKDFFKQLLITYQTIDKRGCSIVGNNIVPSQAAISLTELYGKHPNLKWYCSPTQGILPDTLTFFLKAEKAVQYVIDGKNIGSSDIRDLSLTPLSPSPSGQFVR